MQSTQEDKMSREEIIYYVDNLIEANKKSYDKRLAPLLYEFFLRANEKFEWSRKEFLEKYQNFRNNVKIIEFERIDAFGRFNYKDRKIILDKDIEIIIEGNVKYNKKNMDNNIISQYLIDTLFHECLHATDLYIKDNKTTKFGIYEVCYPNGANLRDTMLNEFANVLSASLISSDKPMYSDNLGINTENVIGYESLHIPGSIMCCAFDMTEIEIAKLKDKGRESFNLYLKNKFLYFRNGTIEDNLDIFAMGLNIIRKSTENEDKANISYGLENVIDTALELIRIRLDECIGKEENTKEKLERIYYDTYKIQKLLEKVDEFYKIDGSKKVYSIEIFNRTERLLNRVRLYNRFIENKDLFTTKEKEEIYSYAEKWGGFLNDDVIKNKFQEDYTDKEFDIEEIAKKYYVPSNEPLNDNTKLIKQVKKKFRNSIKERIYQKATEIIRKAKYRNLKLLPLPNLVELEIAQKDTNIRNSLKYETPLIHDISTKQQDTYKDDEESTRDGNEDIR